MTRIRGILSGWAVKCIGSEWAQRRPPVCWHGAPAGRCGQFLQATIAWLDLLHIVPCNSHNPERTPPVHAKNRGEQRPVCRWGRVGAPPVQVRAGGGAASWQCAPCPQPPIQASYTRPPPIKRGPAVIEPASAPSQLCSGLFRTHSLLILALISDII